MRARAPLPALLLAGLALPALAGLALPALAEAGMLAGSLAFHHRGPVPVEHTCHGADRSPPLWVAHAPPGTRTLALVMADPDVPVSAMGLTGLVNFTHWLVWNVPAAAEAVSAFPEDALPAGASQAAPYRGPCPPVPGDRHRYHFEFHALDASLDLGAGATRAQLEAAMEGHVLATTTLLGTHARPLPG